MLDYTNSNTRYAEKKHYDQIYSASYIIGALLTIVKMPFQLLYNALFIPSYSFALIISPRWTISTMTHSYAMINRIPKNELISKDGVLTDVAINNIKDDSSFYNRCVNALLFIVSPITIITKSIYNIPNVFRASVNSINSILMCFCCHPVLMTDVVLNVAQGMPPEKLGDILVKAGNIGINAVKKLPPAQLYSLVSTTLGAGANALQSAAPDKFSQIVVVANDEKKHELKSKPIKPIHITSDSIINFLNTNGVEDEIVDGLSTIMSSSLGKTVVENLSIATKKIQEIGLDVVNDLNEMKGQVIQFSPESVKTYLTSKNVDAQIINGVLTMMSGSVGKDTIKKINASYKAQAESQAANKNSFVANIGESKNNHEAKSYQVFARMSDGSIKTVDVSDKTTIKEFKKMINHDDSDGYLTQGGRIFEDNKTLGEYAIQKETTFDSNHRFHQNKDKYRIVSANNTEDLSVRNDQATAKSYQVFARMSDGSIKTVDVSDKTTIKEFKKMINHDDSDGYLTQGGRIFEDNKTLGEYAIQKETTFDSNHRFHQNKDKYRIVSANNTEDLSVRNDQATAKSYQVFARMSDGSIKTVDVSDKTTIKEFKKMINHDDSDGYLTQGGRIFEDNKTLGEYAIQKETTFDSNHRFHQNKDKYRIVSANNTEDLSVRNDQATAKKKI